MTTTLEPGTTRTREPGPPGTRRAVARTSVADKPGVAGKQPSKAAGKQPSKAAGKQPSKSAGSRRRGAARRPAGRPNATYFLLLGLFVTLNLIGLVMVLSASSVTSQADFGNPWYYAQRQAVWVAIGLVAVLVVQRYDYHRLTRWANLGLLGVIVLLLAVLIPGVGVARNGATRWLGWGPVGIQPSELAKLAALVWVAQLLGRRFDRMDDSRLTLRPVLVAGSVLAGLIMAQPNLGTTLVLGAIILTLLYSAGSPPLRLAGLGLIGVSLATALAFAAPYRRARMFAYLDPWADPRGNGYQTLQAWSAIAEGGIWGVGVGAGRAKWGFLPEAHTDFIFAIIGEEFGLVGASVVVSLFVLLGLLGIRTALRAPDALGMLLAVGATAWFVVQAFVNLGAVLGVLPITGVPLPFVSLGGSSLIASMVAAGMLLNVARQGRPAADSADS